MVDYAEVRVGDILRVVSKGATWFAAPGDLVRVLKVYENGVLVENKDGVTCQYLFNCGAAQLEPTEWRNDFPAEG